jgi:hypothetical protein
LFEQGHLFENRNLESVSDQAYRFAEMLSLLGHPPLEFLRRSKESLKFWDEDGSQSALTIHQQPLLICGRQLEGRCADPRTVFGEP